MEPEPNLFTASQQGRPVYGMPPRPRPRHSRVLLIGLPVVAVFTAFAAIVWMAHDRGAGGSLVREPLLIRAETTPIKLWPEPAPPSREPSGPVIEPAPARPSVIAQSTDAAPSRPAPPENSDKSAEAALNALIAEVSERPPQPASAPDRPQDEGEVRELLSTIPFEQPLQRLLPDLEEPLAPPAAVERAESLPGAEPALGPMTTPSQIGKAVPSPQPAPGSDRPQEEDWAGLRASE
jgi:hypothetical protein